MAEFDKPYTTIYQSAVGSKTLSCTIFSYLTFKVTTLSS